MGLESGPQRGITIEPRSLIAAADPNVVTPTAVEALTDAFRKGAVTVDDISARRDQAEQRKMQLAQMQQQQAFDNDPMIQEVKKTVAIAAGAKAKADIERNKREIDLAPLLDQAARAKTIRDIDADESRGESEKMSAKFQAAGVETPKTPEGFVDVEAARKTGEEIDEWARNAIYDAALAKSVKFEKKKAADGSVKLAPFSENLGRFLSDAEYTGLKSKEGQPQTFKAWKAARAAQPAPITPAVAPVEIIQLSPEEAATQRARLVNEGRIDPAAGLSDAEVSALVQPKSATSAPKVDIFPTTLAAPDRTLEEAPLKSLAEKTPTEAQQRALLALPRFAEANTALQDLQRKNYDPTTWKSWVNGMMPEILKSGNRKEYETAIAAWSQGLLRLESGAAISLKEQVGYEKAFFPQVGDPAHVVQQKENLRHAVEETVAQVGSAGNIAPEISARADALFKQALVNAGGKVTAETAAQPPKKLSTGRTIGVTSSGQYYVIP